MEVERSKQNRNFLNIVTIFLILIAPVNKLIDWLLHEVRRLNFQIFFKDALLLMVVTLGITSHLNVTLFKLEQRS
jgi:hypothetical protein